MLKKQIYLNCKSNPHARELMKEMGDKLNRNMLKLKILFSIKLLFFQINLTSFFFRKKKKIEWGFILYRRFFFFSFFQGCQTK